MNFKEFDAEMTKRLGIELSKTTFKDDGETTKHNRYKAESEAMEGLVEFHTVPLVNEVEAAHSIVNSCIVDNNGIKQFDELLFNITYPIIECHLYTNIELDKDQNDRFAIFDVCRKYHLSDHLKNSMGDTMFFGKCCEYYKNNALADNEIGVVFNKSVGSVMSALSDMLDSVSKALDNFKMDPDTIQQMMDGINDINGVMKKVDDVEGQLKDISAKQKEIQSKMK